MDHCRPQIEREREREKREWFKRDQALKREKSCPASKAPGLGVASETVTKGLPLFITALGHCSHWRHWSLCLQLACQSASFLVQSVCFSLFFVFEHGAMASSNAACSRSRLASTHRRPDRRRPRWFWWVSWALFTLSAPMGRCCQEANYHEASGVSVFGMHEQHLLDLPILHNMWGYSWLDLKAKRTWPCWSTMRAEVLFQTQASQSPAARALSSGAWNMIVSMFMVCAACFLVSFVMHHFGGISHDSFSSTYVVLPCPAWDSPLMLSSLLQCPPLCTLHGVLATQLRSLYRLCVCVCALVMWALSVPASHWSLSGPCQDHAFGFCMLAAMCLAVCRLPPPCLPPPLLGDLSCCLMHHSS